MSLMPLFISLRSFTRTGGRFSVSVIIGHQPRSLQAHKDLCRCSTALHPVPPNQKVWPQLQEVSLIIPLISGQVRRPECFSPLPHRQGPSAHYSITLLVNHPKARVHGITVIQQVYGLKIGHQAVDGGVRNFNHACELPFAHFSQFPVRREE